MRALIYVRCASASGSSGDNSVVSQKKDCLAFAKENGYEVDANVDTYTDVGVSGMTLDGRPSFQKMIQRLKSDPNIGVVIVRDISRIARNLAKYLEFKKEIGSLGKKIISATEPIGGDTPTDRLLEHTLVSMAEFRHNQTDSQKSHCCTCVCYTKT